MFLSGRAALGCLLALIVVFSELSAVAAAIPKLDAPPEGERWFSINLTGEKVGFAHVQISKAEDGYRIDTESGVKMQGLGFSRDSTTRASYLVGRDLALRSFSAVNRLDGKTVAVMGEMTPKGIKIAESEGSKKERTLLAKGAVYPSEVLNIYPLLQGAKPKKVFKISMLDLDSLKVKQVKIEVIGMEALPAGTAALHLKNNLFPIVDNDIWVDLRGNTLKESVRDDFVVTQAEDEKTAKLYLADGALSKRDPVLEFSRIGVETLDRPGQLHELTVEVIGIPPTLPLLQGKVQRATRSADEQVIFVMPNPTASLSVEAPAAGDLESTPLIPRDNPAIIGQKNGITGTVKDQAQMARLLEEWVTKEIKETGSESQTPLETLKSREGNCLSHARLYAALARAAGIPTRIVSGLVYLPKQGFLYHSWAESYLNGWIAVDPTLGEMPVNLTHIKLVQGDTADDMVLLAGAVGRVKANITGIKRQ